MQQMIQLTVNSEGSLYIDQWCVPPIVYLDHWAWRKISESESLTKRFSDAMKSCGGTLAFSWLNVIEFSKVTDKEQSRKADVLLHAVWPQVFILHPNFFKVIEKEKEMLAGGERFACHADLDTLRAIYKLSSQKPNSLHPLPAPNLFSIVPLTGITHDDIADSIVDHIESLRQDYCTNHEFRLAVNRLPKGNENEFGTRFIARELLGSFIKDKGLQTGKNRRHHAMDVSHAIVAVAYCDYVLLDSHWATQVEQARHRIEAGGLIFPMAKVFSENGMQTFLQELESWQLAR